MLWRLSRHPRLLQSGRACPPLRLSGCQPPRTHLSTTAESLPTVASVFAVRTDDDKKPTVVEVVGAVRTIRKQKHHAFLEIGDGSSVHSLQAVLKPDQVQGEALNAVRTPINY